MQILNLKERYPFTCECGENGYSAAPSIFMSAFQANHGGIWCPTCKKHHHCRIDENNERMILYPDGLEADEVAKNPAHLPDACFREATPEEEEIIKAREK